MTPEPGGIFIAVLYLAKIAVPFILQMRNINVLHTSSILDNKAVHMFVNLFPTIDFEMLTSC